MKAVAVNVLRHVRPVLGRVRRNPALNTLGRLAGGIIEVRRDIRSERRKLKLGREDFAHRFAPRP